MAVVSSNTGRSAAGSRTPDAPPARSYFRSLTPRVQKPTRYSNDSPPPPYAIAPRKLSAQTPSKSHHEQQPSAKRRRATFHSHPPDFWDALSNITPIRKALREFDRRTTQEKTARLVGSARQATQLFAQVGCEQAARP